MSDIFFSFCRMKVIAILLITWLVVLVQSTPLMMLGTTKKRLNRRNNDKYKFWNGGRSSPITYIQTLPSSFNNGLLNLFGIRTAQNTPEERSNGDSIANSIFRYICTYHKFIYDFRCHGIFLL